MVLAEDAAEVASADEDGATAVVTLDARLCTSKTISFFASSLTRIHDLIGLVRSTDYILIGTEDDLQLLRMEAMEHGTVVYARGRGERWGKSRHKA